MAKPSSQKFYPYGGITHEQAVRTLQELKKLVASGLTPQQLNAVCGKNSIRIFRSAVMIRDRVVYRILYADFDGSPVRTDRFRYPLYKQPADLLKGLNGTMLGQVMPNWTDSKIPQQAGFTKFQYPCRMSWSGLPIRLRFI